MDLKVTGSSPFEHAVSSPPVTSGEAQKKIRIDRPALYLPEMTANTRRPEGKASLVEDLYRNRQFAGVIALHAVINSEVELAAIWDL